MKKSLKYILLSCLVTNLLLQTTEVFEAAESKKSKVSVGFDLKKFRKSKSDSGSDPGSNIPIDGEGENNKDLNADLRLTFVPNLSMSFKEENRGEEKAILPVKSIKLAKLKKTETGGKEDFVYSAPYVKVANFSKEKSGWSLQVSLERVKDLVNGLDLFLSVGTVYKSKISHPISAKKVTDLQNYSIPKSVLVREGKAATTIFSAKMGEDSEMTWIYFGDGGITKSQLRKSDYVKGEVSNERLQKIAEQRKFDNSMLTAKLVWALSNAPQIT